MFVIIFSGIWGLIGIIFSIIGIVMLKNSYSWRPVFEYNIGELKFIKESSYGSSQSKYAIGQNVEIYYNPEDYNEYYVVGDTLPKTLGTIFTIVGIIAIIISIVSTILLL